MADVKRIDLFCEDSGHEQFTRALIIRLADEAGVRIQVRPQRTRGGHGRAISELKAWQRLFMKHRKAGLPDVLVVVIDGNCSGPIEARQAVQKAIEANVFPEVIIGCPDPHIERWFIADPSSFRQVVGGVPGSDPGKCERDIYKQLVRNSIAKAGAPLLTDIDEYATELVEVMDLYRAGKAQASLGHFVSELRRALLSLT